MRAAFSRRVAVGARQGVCGRQGTTPAGRTVSGVVRRGRVGGTSRAAAVAPAASRSWPVVGRTEDFHSAAAAAAKAKPREETRAEMVGQKLIPVIGRLQEVQGLVGVDGAGIELPQIVVVGAQSSGKSSVLENIVGRDFLPRGGDLVTRRPLVLQLHRIDEDEASRRRASNLPEEYCEFAHKPGQTFFFAGTGGTNPVTQEIIAETERLCGGDRTIRADPISLHVHSPHVLPLTLVDTPGLTRVPVGDQPPDIEQQIRKMLLDYIHPENTIILAVSAANQDLATSDSLQLARRVDPDGHRTIGVVTKLDLMDKGTERNGLRMLSGEAIPLRLGYIGVVNRSQTDIDQRLPIHDSLQQEKKFFASHPTFRVLAERSGTAYLASTCNRLLSSHIQRALPTLRAQVSAAYNAKQSELENLGAPVTNTDTASLGWLLLHMINRITDQYKTAIDGQGADEDLDPSSEELNGGARLRFIFHDTFAKEMEAIDPLAGLSNNDIKTAIRNAAGPRPSLFVPERAFENLFRRQLELLRVPCHRAAEVTMDELLRMIWSLEQKSGELSRFPRLGAKVTEIGANTLREALVPTLAHIDALLECEAAYINTQHRDFIGRDTMLGKSEDPNTVQNDAPRRQEREEESGGFFSAIFGGSKRPRDRDDLPPPVKPAVPTRFEPGHELSERDRRQIALLRKLMSSYYGIVQSNVQDSVTKAIMHFLVNRSKADLHKNLVHSLYRDELLKELLQEDSGVAAKREAAREQLKALTVAKSLLQEAELMQ